MEKISAPQGLGDFATNVGRYVAGMLKEADVTQKTLCVKLDRSTGYVSRRINSHDAWTLDELDIIARIIGYDGGLGLLEEIEARMKREKLRTITGGRRTAALSEPADTLRAVADSDRAADRHVEGFEEQP